MKNSRDGERKTTQLGQYSTGTDRQTDMRTDGQEYILSQADALTYNQQSVTATVVACHKPKVLSMDRL